MTLAPTPTRLAHVPRVIRLIRRALWRHVGRFLVPRPPHRKERQMTEYLVTWRIFVEAASPEDAAREALAVQRNPESEATGFEVRGAAGREVTIVVREPETPARPHLRLVKTSHA